MGFVWVWGEIYVCVLGGVYGCVCACEYERDSALADNERLAGMYAAMGMPGR